MWNQEVNTVGIKATLTEAWYIFATSYKHVYKLVGSDLEWGIQQI